jgi:small-conductance mechanosensitive channel
MKQFLLLLLLLSQTLLADLNITGKVSKIISELSQPLIKDKNSTHEKNLTDRRNGKGVSDIENSQIVRIKEQRANFLKELDEINTYLQDDNIWSKVYSNYETYKQLEFMLSAIDKRIKFLEKKKKKRRQLTKKEIKALKKYKDEYKTTEGKLAQLKEYKENPFKSLLKPDDIGEVPVVLSPLDIVKAISFQKHLIAVEDDYNSRFKSLQNMVLKLNEKKKVLENFIKFNMDLNITDETYIDEYENVSRKLETYNRTVEIFKTSKSALERKISELQLNIKEEISKQIEKGILIGSIILFLLLGFLIIKYLVKRYMSENELFYTANKALNFTFITIIVMILLFSYLENVGHLVTILSFASAGIAIALKDWFMSIMGWVVIIFSGSLRVGDRVKFLKDGKQYVGDIVDISLLRMTLHEDITLTTYDVNRRAGRVIFVPNNYIFTEMVANYSHSGLKTVWDGIDFVITFSSDINKAQAIAKEVARKYSKGYTDMTRKQLNKLRSKYSMKNTAVEPRIFAFFDANGIKISVWYLTNAYATLTLRSTISMELFNRIREEDSISMAFPTQSIYINQPAPKELKKSNEPFEEKSNKKYEKSSNDVYKPDDWGLY